MCVCVKTMKKTLVGLSVNLNFNPDSILGSLPGALAKSVFPSAKWLTPCFLNSTSSPVQSHPSGSHLCLFVLPGEGMVRKDSFQEEEAGDRK